ncbi:class I adenylate-forming enzyme family protein [Virgisporangium aurantiacum]|uniref:Fatty-acyl-CoA synthase n=1 Tax=Virgisporangium aurantiacum TaxID=175570 RepID=A0A8J4DYN8_9ACTN|nr:class I adenylate-forming enzyme family protein [Virgisporangium aurantiacum]GIJ55855.1 fatty-acyl-CoA synthase [Virgisporangium aurantiacum]
MLDELAAALRRQDSDRPAVIGKLTRGELADLADRYAVALHHSGLSTGDTLGIAVRPGPRALAVMLAAHRLGLRVAVLDPTAGPDVLVGRLRLAAPRLVVADAAAQAAAGWAAPVARRAGLALPSLRAIAPVVTVGRRLPGCAPALAGRDGAPPPAFDGDGDALVIFTSGTTSRPRAVVHTRASVAAGTRAVADLVRPAPGVPVVGGTLFVLVPALACGAPVAQPARSPRRLARQLAAIRPQATYLTPPQLRAALSAGARFTGSVYSGSAPVSATLLGRVVAAGADDAYGVYALTEIFPAAVVSAAEKTAYTGTGDLVGAPLPGVRASVDRAGVLRLSAPQAADRYLGEPSLSTVDTGDVGHVIDGRVVLGGRAKDMILRGAENIYPGLYEPALHVPGVDLALLVGVPAGDGDERLVAVVQPRAGASARAVRAALDTPLRRMGSARPDAVLLADVPLTGRSRKPDRAAAAAFATRYLAQVAP